MLDDLGFCPQVWQIQFLFLLGEWEAGKEVLQGAVRLHLQVTQIKRDALRWTDSSTAFLTTFPLSSSLGTMCSRSKSIISIQNCRRTGPMTPMFSPENLSLFAFTPRQHVSERKRPEHTVISWLLSGFWVDVQYNWCNGGATVLNRKKKSYSGWRTHLIVALIFHYWWPD